MKLNLNKVKTYATMKKVFKAEDQPFVVSEEEGKALLAEKDDITGEAYFVVAPAGDKKTVTIGKKDEGKTETKTESKEEKTGSGEGGAEGGESTVTL